ncbi:hypothetical protein N9734_00020 [Alphaproteobacteria bacterium]|nr:hypothetical protein [Alphaproteobacteria bacterium]
MSITSYDLEACVLLDFFKPFWGIVASGTSIDDTDPGDATVVLAVSSWRTVAALHAPSNAVKPSNMT